MKNLAPSNPKDRFEVYRFFNGLSSEAKEGLDTRRLRTPLVKTFLLEHVASRDHCKPKAPEDIFRALGADVRKLDADFMALSFKESDPEANREYSIVPGFLEQYDERFFAYYTCEDSVAAKKRWSKWIQTPDLDAAWFTSPLLQALWEQDVSKRGDDRFTRLKFRHESIFDMPEDFSAIDEIADDPDAEVTAEDSNVSEDRQEFERRKARFEMGDRIGKIRGALSKLQNNYSPLHVMHAIRFPSRAARGAHDLFQDGQITNRTDSFEDHRNTVRYLYRIYKFILEATERCAWHQINQEQAVRKGFKGVPLIIKFAEPLRESTFNRWIRMAFQKRNRFKLWGAPIRLGPMKVHVYGADRHLWQPINLELSADGVVAVLPQGTCGNTFHRLVTNIQQYVCPKIDAWVGSEPFDQIVGRWPSGAERSDED
jgi:hypothetical protein